jgi:NitT/TauT family transport system substrate-binding protein
MDPRLLNKTLLQSSVDARRRRLLAGAAGGGALAALGAPKLVRAESAPKIRIGYWPVAAGLPFFAAIEKGYFKEAGLDVEPLKFAGAQQVMEAMLAGRSDGSSNGTGSANLAIGEIAQPGLFKIFATNPSNAKHVLDEFLLPKDSPVKSLAELKGKRVASGPGIQNMTLAKTMLERAGARRGPARRRLHARADRHRRPAQRHDAAARSRRRRALHPRRPDGAVARRLGEPHDRVHQEVPGRDQALHRRLRPRHRARAQQAR